MKWLIFISAILMTAPAGILLKRRPRLIPYAWGLVGFLPFFMANKPDFDIGLLSWPTYLGDSHGIEISLMDLLVLSLYFSLPPGREALPFRFARAGYLLAVLLSAVQAFLPTATFFYASKLFRMYLLFAVLARAARDPRIPPAVLTGMALGVLMEAGLAIWQRYGLGIQQVTGTFAHQNTLGLTVNMVVLATLPVIFAEKSSWLAKATPAAGVVIAVLTVSRGALGLLALGGVAILAATFYRGFTRRKAVVALVILLLGAAAAPVALGFLQKRFSGQSREGSEYHERKAYETAAKLMLEDHPMGVGANHFTFVMNRGYADRAGIAPTWSSRSGIVHSVYWLTAAEMGYLGLIMYVLLVAGPTLLALRYGLQREQDVRRDVLVGIGVALGGFLAHGTVEWVPRTTEPSYVFWTMAALAVGLARQLGVARPRVFWRSRRSEV